MGNKSKGKARLKNSNKTTNLPEKPCSKKSTSKAVKRKITQDNCENQVLKKPRTRTRVIQTLLDKASKKIGYSKKKTKSTMPEDEFQCDSQESEVVFPHILATNWKRFEDTILQRNVNEITKKLNSCRAKMQFNEFRTHFTGFHFVQTAIVDALLNRKWDNLLQLTVMLVRSYFNPVYRIFIRNVSIFQLLNKMSYTIFFLSYAKF